MPGKALLITGPEEFLRRRAEAQALAEFGASANDVVVVDDEKAHGLDVAQLLDELRTGGLFAPRKAVVLREAGKLLAEPALARFIERELERQSHLLLIVNCEKPPAALAKALARHGAVQEFKRLWATDYRTGAISPRSPLGNWLRKEAEGRGLRLDDEAVIRVVEVSGQDAAQALEALEAAALTACAGRISAEQIDALAGVQPTDACAVLERCVLDYDIAGAGQIIEQAYRDGMYRFGRYTHSEGAMTGFFIDALMLAALTLYRMKCGGLAAREAGAYRQKEAAYSKRAAGMKPEDAAELVEASFRAEWLFKAGLANGHDALVWLAGVFCGLKAPDPGAYGEVLTRR